jgi:hypothetical protein
MAFSFTQRLTQHTVPVFIQASYATLSEIDLTTFRFVATCKTSIPRLWLGCAIMGTDDFYRIIYATQDFIERVAQNYALTN